MTKSSAGCWALQFEVTLHGRATHGSMPHTGHDALQAATQLLQTIYAKAAELTTIKSAIAGIDHPTMIVGRIEGGTNTNVVPGKVVLKMDRRMIPEEDPATVEAEVREMIENAVRDLPGIRVEIKRLLLARNLSPLPGHKQMLDAIQKNAREVLGEDIPANGSPLYADARLYSEHGIPVVMYGAGPRTLMESNAKQADENVELETLRKATKVIALTLADFLVQK